MKLSSKIEWRLMAVLAIIALMGSITVVTLSTNLASSLTYFALTKAKDLKLIVSEHFTVGLVIYFFCYTIAVVLCLPVLIAMSIIGGFFFNFWGLPIAVLALASGASFFLVFSDKHLHQFVKNPLLGTRLNRVNRLYQKSSLLWIFVLRLVPVLPFFLVTVAAAVFPTRLSSFFWGTVLGTLPVTFLYVWFGQSVAMIELIDQKFYFTDFISSKAAIPAVFLLVLTIILAVVARRF